MTLTMSTFSQHSPVSAADAPLFEPLDTGRVRLPNRFVRSATYEGMGLPDGSPSPELGDLYAKLAAGGVGAIVTGFAFSALEGRAMQPRQCGLHDDAVVPAWRTVVERARGGGGETRLFAQLAHAGRQTRREFTGCRVVGVSRRGCRYFRARPAVLATDEVDALADGFARAALRARQAGFDGVQVHAAHGYLIHQFLSPWTNQRRDRWGDRPLFLEEVVRRIRSTCGEDFAVWVKLSWCEERRPGITLESTRETLSRLEAVGADAAEISVGTMEHPLNIFRGGCPVEVALRINPLFNRLPRPILALWKWFCLPAWRRRQVPFSEGYNLDAAASLASGTRLPIVAVGGLRRVETMRTTLARGVAAVALCRPLIRNPDLPRRIAEGRASASTCTNCNLCAVHCDGPESLRCHVPSTSSPPQEN